MHEVKRWAWDIAYGSLGGVYISTMLYIDSVMKAVKGINHEDFDFWWGKATAAVIFLLVAIYHVKRIVQLSKKHKHEVATSAHFDSKILAGNDLKELKLYDLAIKHYTLALELNYDNEMAQHKINEVKHLIEIHK
jgi:hypothetical protein